VTVKAGVPAHQQRTLLSSSSSNRQITLKTDKQMLPSKLGVHQSLIHMLHV